MMENNRVVFYLSNTCNVSCQKEKSMVEFLHNTIAECFNEIKKILHVKCVKTEVVDKMIKNIPNT